MEKHPLHLKIPELQTSPEVSAAVEKHERLSGDKLPNDPSERIEAYTDRLENIFLNKDERVRERNLEMFRDKIYDELLIKRDKFPESYFELQQRVARERGQAVEEIPPQVREQMKDVAIEDQKHSLDAWIDYLTSPDAVYQAWFKYYAWTQITKLSQFDKERGEFKERTETTVAPFPDIYRESLAKISDLYEQYPKILKEVEPKLQLLRAQRNKLKKISKTKDGDERTIIENEIFAINQEIEEVSAPIRDFDKKFPTLYAELTSESLAASMEGKEEIQGEWVKYEQNREGDAEKLFESLEGKGTGWCTAGRSTAETQIDCGDFYVFYTIDKDGAPTQPRLAIRMDGENKIGEVRGILPHQNVEPQMQEVLNEKLKDFGPEADRYKNKAEDMKFLTAIDNKYKAGETLTRDELVFLYEINKPIEGFGYEKDPRIAEIVEEKKDKQELFYDMQIIFECTPEQIAHNPREITPDIKAYVGPIEKGIFQRLPKDLAHIYTSFPEGKIQKYHTEIGGRTKAELKQELAEKKIYISDWANQLMDSSDFTVLKSMEAADLVRLTVKDLGFPSGATTDEIYKSAGELGLELCPAEVGPQLRLRYSGGDWMYIAMKQIADRGGDPRVFYLYRVGAVLKLNAYGARPSDGWDSDDQFVFLLRKRNLKT